MGKIKANPAVSMKISSKDHEHKKHFNSLIKVLRPKVYITDSSSFKRLVQELTGNGNPIPTPISSPPPSTTTTFPQPLEENFPFVENIHHHEDQILFQESSTELSIDYSLSPQQSLPASFTAFESSSSEQSSSAQMDYSQFRDMESWLLEIDHHQFPPEFYHEFYNIPSAHQGGFVYDYDLSGLI